MKRTVKTFPYFEFPGDDFVLDAVVTIGVHVPVAFDTAVNMSYAYRWNTLQPRFLVRISPQTPVRAPFAGDAYRKSPPGKTLP